MDIEAKYIRDHMGKFLSLIGDQLVLDKDPAEFLEFPYSEDKELDTLTIYRSDKVKLMTVQKTEDDLFYLTSFGQDGESVIYSGKINTLLDFNNYRDTLVKILRG